MREGQKATFFVGSERNPKDWDVTPEEFANIVAHDGQPIVVTGVAVDDRDESGGGPHYLNIQFEDGLELQGIDVHNLRAEPAGRRLGRHSGRNESKAAELVSRLIDS